jgi:hypothetical protein
MKLDLTDDETQALVEHVKRAIDNDPYPLSPRLAPLKAILAKLDPPEPRPEALPPLRGWDGAEWPARATAEMKYSGPW